MPIFPPAILAAHTLISYASQKHTHNSYIYYQAGIGTISYIECLLKIIANNPMTSSFNVKTALIVPTIPSIMRMGTGYVIGAIAYECIN